MKSSYILVGGGSRSASPVVLWNRLFRCGDKSMPCRKCLPCGMNCGAGFWGGSEGLYYERLCPEREPMGGWPHPSRGGARGEECGSI
ncbi:hypothetical protein, partial [Acetobacter malorum]|uniref:hypothetical protein n=1 Tax=Acetobacter malorum TaxID=178901 RepID=UPI001E297166